MNGALLPEVCSVLTDLPVTTADVDLPCIPGWLKLPEPDLLRIRIKNTPGEIKQAAELRPGKIVVSYVQRSGKCPAQTLNDTLAYLKGRTGEISLCIENASALSFKEIEPYLAVVDEFKIKSLIYQDGHSLLDSFATEINLKAWQERIPTELEFHAHNGLGLATANALAAIRAGVRHIAVSVGGTGYSGHAALEEVMMACKLLDLPIDTTRLAQKCDRILTLLGITLPATKAVIGQNIFAHESGIHVDGVLKQPSLYELFSPDQVGLTRKLVLGKHSGMASLKAKLAELSLDLDDEAARSLLTTVRRFAVEQKKSPDDLTLRLLTSDSIMQYI